ncbi:hypothetical protein CDO11_11745 [Xanthomonas oryzae pv. oryzae]|uniref:Minor coat protein n=2 Tax=root TaxID=1 RepID=A0A1D6ZIU5_9VIRU|nr:minor coat protein [Xanthomonas phage Xf109]ANO58020.1 minor coat protein [Xanthomonas phage Xf109]AXI17461.1 hypothetical protein CDO19_10490 [Xanthomonas oryzae pv. oryzae]AXI21604.1 hypothetical protein CDO11_11745 [Xanthomonas oryzae pv. oryzae]BAE68898.1 phage-related protein [Xanthomonas oryzae pv. oryzae MAFF 311018]
MAGGLRDCLRGFRIMGWLARVFASAIARRLAYVLVAATLAWCGIGCASAQDFGTQGAAYSACMSQTAAYLASLGRGANDRNPECNVEQGSQAYRGQFETRDCSSCDWYRAYYGYFPWSKGCDQEPDYTGSGPWGTYVGTARNGSIGCRNGCDGVWFGNGDDTMTWNATGAICPKDPEKTCDAMSGGYGWNGYLGVCEPPPTEECPEGQVPDGKGGCSSNKCPEGMLLQADGTCAPKKNDCPAGQIRSPSGSCLPGDGQCAAGEVRGPDGTCKKDGDGDGEPDEPGEGDKSQFSGGDSCDSPPSCSGDAIMCGQARIQWRIDCNTRRDVNITGGSCASMPVCVGENCKALEYSQLLMQWRAACALEKAANNSGGGTGNNADVKAIRDAITGNGTADIGADGKPADAFSDESGYGEHGYPTGELDTHGFGYSRTCPTIPDVAVFGQTLHFDTSKFCQWMVLGGQIVLVMASLVSLRLMSQGGSA